MSSVAFFKFASVISIQVAVMSRLRHGCITIASRFRHGCVTVASRVCRDHLSLVGILKGETAFVYGAALTFLRLSKAFSFSLSDSQEQSFAKNPTKNQGDSRTRRVRSVWWP